MDTSQEVLDFWFSERVKKLWFNSTEEFDRELTDRFEHLFLRAMKGELDAWARSPEAALALVIVLDQFPLNMYRGKADAYSSGDRAVKEAKAAIEKGFDKKIPESRLAFLFLPFMHSESLEDQDRSVALFENSGLSDNLKFARHHREIIRQYGRFPHRNQALGRISTEAELAYLNSKDAFRG